MNPIDGATTTPRSLRKTSERILVAAVVGAGGPAVLNLSYGWPARAVLVAGVALGWAVVISLAECRSGRWHVAVAASVAWLASAVALAPEGARREFMVAVTLTGVARAALGESVLGDRSPQQPCLPALGAAVAASIGWWRSEGDVGSTTVLLFIAVLLVVAGRRWPWAIAAIGRTIAGLLIGLVHLLVWIGVAIVATAVLYLPGLVGRPLERLRRRRAPEWTPRRTTGVEERALATEPFGPVDPAVRARRLMGGFVVLVVVVATALALVGRGTATPELGSNSDIERSAMDGRLDDPSSRVPFSSLPSYWGVSWADDLQQEQADLLATMEPSPTGGFTVPNASGPFTTVVDGVRRSAQSTCQGCPKVVLWLTGGSVAFGLGQRDDYTVASGLVELAEADGIELTVLNLSVPGSTIWQEYQIAAGRFALGSGARPDIIVSIGVYNDILGTMIERALGTFDAEMPARHDGQSIAEYNRRELSVGHGGGVEATAQAAATRFNASKAAFAQWAESNGIVAEFVAHPDALADSFQFAAVAEVYRGLRPGEAEDYSAVLARSYELLDPPVWNLRDAYRGIGEQVYVDWAHTNERGSALLAASIYRRLAADLRAAAGTQ